MTKEIPLKVWVLDEAERQGVTASAVYNRLARGKYDALPLRRVNARVVYVQVNGGTPMHQHVDTRRRV